MKFLMHYRLIFAAAVFAIIFWISDSLLDGLYFEKSGYFNELWPEDAKELWMRLLLVGGTLLFGIFAQITLNRQERDRQKQLLAATVLQNSSDAMLVADAENRVVEVNQAYERTTGYRRDEVIGKAMRLFSPDEHDEAFGKAFRDRLAQTGNWEGEVRDRRKEGALYPKWMSVTTLLDKDGRLSHYVVSFRDISAKKAAEERLEHLAHFDTLTDLPNRSLLMLRLEQALHQARRNHWNLALIFIDLDHFKEINDGLGHSTGDRLLTEIGKRLVRCVRESDTVARLGGDEFIIVLDNLATTEAVEEVLVKLRSTLDTPVVLEGHDLFVTASMGVSLYPDDGDDPEALLRNADSAMYHVKKEGRNNWSYYSGKMNLQSHRRLQLTSGLRRAIENNEFSLVYQPQLDTSSHRVCGAEALIRWKHPTLGMIGPDEFIPLAEDTGFIEAIGEWVLQESCRQFAAWRTMNLGLPRISVNVSARQFRRAGFTEHIEDLAKKHGLAPGCLNLEITESLLIRTDARLLEGMQRLCDIGISFTIDDFGTGYSSLSYLKRFPISTIKADRSFVKDIPNDKDDIEITAAIISMSHKLKLRVIAEGVESVTQLAFLGEQGCDEIQGNLVCRPLPAAAFEAFVRKPELSFKRPTVALKSVT